MSDPQLTSERANEHPLELSSDEMRAMAHAALERVVEHIESLPRQDASYSGGGEAVARRLAESMPETGTPFTELLDLFFDVATPPSFNTASPGYLAYVPGGGLFHSAIADFLTNAVNRDVGVWVAAPGWVQLEVNVIRWFCSIVGYGPGSGGVLTTGGSLANLMAMITVRRERLKDDPSTGVVYTSDQTHHSVEKAAVLAGVPVGNVRSIRSDEFHRIDLSVLRDRIRDDRSAGFTPFCIVGSAGTTNTGAIDDLDSLDVDALRCCVRWVFCDDETWQGIVGRPGAR